MSSTVFNDFIAEAFYLKVPDSKSLTCLGTSRDRADQTMRLQQHDKIRLDIPSSEYLKSKVLQSSKLTEHRQDAACAKPHTWAHLMVAIKTQLR